MHSSFFLSSGLNTKTREEKAAPANLIINTSVGHTMVPYVQNKGNMLQFSLNHEPKNH